MNGKKTLYNAIRLNPTIQALVNYKGTRPCISSNRVAPRSWKSTDTTVLIYTPTGRDYREEHLEMTYTVNCRAPKEREVEILAVTVVAALNRKSIPTGGRYYCVLGFVIPPQDESDSYNLPVAVTIKAVKELE